MDLVFTLSICGVFLNLHLSGTRCYKTNIIHVCTVVFARAPTRKNTSGLARARKHSPPRLPAISACLAAPSCPNGHSFSAENPSRANHSVSQHISSSEPLSAPQHTTPGHCIDLLEHKTSISRWLVPFPLNPESINLRFKQALNSSYCRGIPSACVGKINTHCLVTWWVLRDATDEARDTHTHTHACMAG